jgi:hypothetical protein
MSIVEKIQQWFIPKLIKLKIIKQVTFSLAELTDDVQVYLPFDIKFSVPNGNGFVIISSIQVSEYENGLLVANLKGTLDIQCMGEHLYNSTIQIEIFGRPIFLKEKSVIRATDVEVGQINLANDNLVVAQNARKIIAKLSNNIVGQMYSLTMGTALSFIGNVTDMKGYVANFINKKSHKILELHRKDIEGNLIESLSNGDLEYTLEDTIPDEKLFIQYGKDIIVENEGLTFRFS